VPGTVIRVLVENDRRVEEGRVLVELDPTDYRVAVERAQAALNQNEAEVRAAEISVPLTDAQTSGQARAAEAALKAARDAESQARHRLGELKNTRSAVAADLEHLAQDPYDKGWFIKIKLSDEAGLTNLLDEAAYQKQCAEEQH
jgi:multidrug resistance efflux pump